MSIDKDPRIEDKEPELPEEPLIEAELRDTKKLLRKAWRRLAAIKKAHGEFCKHDAVGRACLNDGDFLTPYHALRRAIKGEDK